MLTTKDVARLRFELMAREHVIAIGARIRERREELGLSQREVADRMPPPVDGNYISRWERGAHKPSDDTLDQLAEILQTTRGYFLAGPPQKQNGTPDLALVQSGSQLDRIEARLDSIEKRLAALEAQGVAIQMETGTRYAELLESVRRLLRPVGRQATESPNH